ncbi:MAG: GxxExxY protein [Vicinamibacterales bacterium]|nr:GxxExxY protein [Vicinamibacterales bacterium]
MLDRTISTLPAATERIVQAAIGCAIEVHTHFGPGYLESVYQRAFQIELELRGMSYACEQPLKITYKDYPIQGPRLDLVVEQCVLLELKAVDRLQPVHVSQVVSYLKATGLGVGLLMDFNVRWMKDGIRRVVL